MSRFNLSAFSSLLSLKKYLIILLIFLTGCASHPPMTTVDPIDLPKFMGKWYVIAHIPTFVESESYNALEVYELNEDGTVAINFSFNNKSLEGEFKSYNFKAFIDEERNSQWLVQPIWPIKADYKIVYLDDAYEHTVIARQKRDYVWIMARDPEVDEAEYQAMVNLIESLGYDVSKIRQIPHNI